MLKIISFFTGVLCLFNEIINLSVSTEVHTMKFYSCNVLQILVLVTLLYVTVTEANTPKKLQIGVKKRPAECPVKSKKGDLLHMHYTVRFSTVTDLSVSYSFFHTTDYLSIRQTYRQNSEYRLILV